MWSFNQLEMIMRQRCMSYPIN
uniref:Uncharacterized protein n=1 Tax=Rhizophora mucronata TaxID=61149 RepID=A0A2P2QR51_RHIMU